MATKLNHHLYQDPISGIWYFQKKAKGITRPYKFSLDTQSVIKARRKRDELLGQIITHGHILSVEADDIVELQVFGEVALQWSEIIKSRVEETTFINYRKVMNTHILPHFGNRSIESITSLDIEKFISRLKCDSKTKQNILTPFRLVMKFAKKHKIIQLNPFLDVEPIKKTRSSQKRPLTLSEIKKFIEIVDDFWRPLFILLFFTGVRIAEASGLKWKDVLLNDGTIKIERSLVRGNRGKIICKKPKTESSIRDVKLPLFVVESLREQQKRTWNGNGEHFVFLNRAGRPIHRHTLNNAVIKPALKKMGIDTQITVKDTRASYITNSLDQKERMTFVQKQVGHTTTRMIVDHYYRHTSAPDDGAHMEKAWNSTRILPESAPSDFQDIENI